MKGLIATLLCIGFVQVCYAIPRDRETKEAPPATKVEVCEKDRHGNEKCVEKDIPKMKEEKKTRHDGGKETR